MHFAQGVVSSGLRMRGASRERDSARAPCCGSIDQGGEGGVVVEVELGGATANVYSSIVSVHTPASPECSQPPATFVRGALHRPLTYFSRRSGGTRPSEHMD